ncbi:MAG: archease [Gammaproteobacteria bacterium]|nr:MAG: archease [Gammaproteobacteria bacterium]
MLRYEPIYDITADAGIRVYAFSQDQLICNSVKAMVNEMVSLQKVQPKEEVTLEVESVGFPYLIADVLNKVLYLFDVKKFVPSECKVVKLTPDGTKVKLLLKGEKYDPQRHGRKLLIKAATYHRLKVEEGEKRLTAEVIFDI